MAADPNSLLQELKQSLIDLRPTFWSLLSAHNPLPFVCEESVLDGHDPAFPDDLCDFMDYRASAETGRSLKDALPSERADFLARYLSDIRAEWSMANPFPVSDRLRRYLQEPALADNLAQPFTTRLLFLFWKQQKAPPEVLFDREAHRELIYELFADTKSGAAGFIKLCGAETCAPLLERHPLSGRLPVSLNWYWYYLVAREIGEEALETVQPREFLPIIFCKLYVNLATGCFLSFIPDDWLSYWRQDCGNGLSLAEYLLIECLHEDGMSDAGRTWLRTDFLRQYPQFRVLSLLGDDDVCRRNLTAKVRDYLSEAQACEDRLYIVGQASNSGLGRNAEVSKEAFTAAGITPVPIFADKAPFVPEAQAVEEGTQTDRPIVLFHTNANRFPRDLMHLPLDLQKRAYRIGFFLWEASELPADNKLALDLVDEIWVPSRYLQKIFSRYTDKPVHLVGKGLFLPPPVPKFNRQELGLEEDDFVFLNISNFDSSLVRKNPLGAVEAFQAAFPDDPKVKLVLKTLNVAEDHWSNLDKHWQQVVHLAKSDPRVVILDRHLPDSGYWGLLRSCDAFISLHRSEGFGYGLVDALQLGKPVVVSDYSGSQDFCSAETASLVPVTEVFVPEGALPGLARNGAKWGDPDLTVAAQQLRNLRENADLGQQQTEKAKALLQRTYSPYKLTSKYKNHYRRIVGKAGKAGKKTGPTKVGNG
ncbi:glycosyltransferase [Rhodovibrionaceae bacterium A322]